MPTDAAMTGKATITFSQTGVQPPVYVVTSLSGWTTLEMDVDKEQTASGNFVFTKEFADVAEGSYHYKIRIGEDHWVVDESKESATDESGNLNNVIQVKPASPVDSPTTASDATTKEEAVPDTPQQEAPAKRTDTRKDSTIDSNKAPQLLVPFVVVEKVADKEQPAHSDAESISLPADPAKRAADAEPDFEEVKADASVEMDPPKSPEVPLLVVEKTDDKPAYGDDFGEDATTAQRVAHDMRAADASPDRLVVTPDPHVEPGTADEQAAPLFRHESFQADDSPPASPMEPIDEDSVQSSTDQTSSGDAINTPSEQDEVQGDDQPNLEPLFPHENGVSNRSGELETESLLPHETGRNEEDTKELEKAPLLSHESGLHDHSEVDSDEEDELDKFPLLSHETFTDRNGSEITTNNGSFEDGEDAEPQHYGPYGDDEDDDEGFEARVIERDYATAFSHEDEFLDDHYNEAPLLPHERVARKSDSDMSTDGGSSTSHGQPAVGYDADIAKDLFSGGGRKNLFRTRTNSSTLPHKLPRSDEEDDDLHDPSLERFPTSREQILERVASIPVQLPEDEPMEDSLHSPQLSVLSQACSSVDLAPVKSCISLASVPEVDDSDEEEDQDVESPGSSVFIGGSSTQPSQSTSGFGRDPHDTPIPDDSKRLGHAGETTQVPNSHTADSSEADSVDKHDGAKDATSVLSAVRDIATPTNVLNPFTPPLTPDEKGTAKEVHQVSTSDSELRQRRGLEEDSNQKSQAPPVAASEETGMKDKVASAVTPAFTKQPDKRNGTALTTPIGASAAVLGVAIAAYYFLAPTS